METLTPIIRWADSKTKIFLKAELSDVKVCLVLQASLMLSFFGKILFSMYGPTSTRQ